MQTPQKKVPPSWWNVSCCEATLLTAAPPRMCVINLAHLSRWVNLTSKCCGIIKSTNLFLYFYNQHTVTLSGIVFTCGFERWFRCAAGHTSVMYKTNTTQARIQLAARAVPSSLSFFLSFFHMLAEWSWNARKGSKWRKPGDLLA